VGGGARHQRAGGDHDEMMTHHGAAMCVQTGCRSGRRSRARPHRPTSRLPGTADASPRGLLRRETPVDRIAPIPCIAAFRALGGISRAPRPSYRHRGHPANARQSDEGHGRP
jgi:hypothetical protein